jgi:mannose-6-phosphate isomerase-like protein (cupin superfamily)
MTTTETIAAAPLRFLQNTVRVHVDAPASSGAYALVELAGPRGDMPPLHVHQREDEAFYILAGRMTIFVGDRRIELDAGGCAFAPRGVPHAYRVESDEARWLALASPPGFETLIREVAANPGAGPDELTEIAGRYGIEILGPPGTLPG